MNVTFTPAAGLLEASLNVTPRAFAKAVLITAFCGVEPGLTVIVDDAPAEFVNEKFTRGRPVEAAVTVYCPPAVPFATKGADATPDALVATVIAVELLLNKPEAPLPGAVNATFTPDTGLLPESLTITARAFAKAVLIVALCGVDPGLAVIADAEPTAFISEKFTGVRPVEAAVTVYGPPAVLFAASGTDATPDPLVAAVIVAVPLLNRTDAPTPGAVNETLTPDNALLPASFTVTATAFAKAVLMAALCGVVPALAVIADGAPTAFVREKLVESPLVAAVTM